MAATKPRKIIHKPKTRDLAIREHANFMLNLADVPLRAKRIMERAKSGTLGRDEQKEFERVHTMMVARYFESVFPHPFIRDVFSYFLSKGGISEKQSARLNQIMVEKIIPEIENYLGKTKDEKSRKELSRISARFEQTKHLYLDDITYAIRKIAAAKRSSNA